MGRGTPVLYHHVRTCLGPDHLAEASLYSGRDFHFRPGHGTPLISVLSNPLATLASNKFRKKRRFRYPDNLDVAPLRIRNTFTTLIQTPAATCSCLLIPLRDPIGLY